MFSFEEALGNNSHYLAPTSPTRLDKYFHRLLVYAIMVLSFMGLTTLVTADMGLECIENCRQSSGRCLDHAEALNKRPYVNAMCEDYEKQDDVPKRFVFFFVCMVYGIIFYVFDSNSDSDTQNLLKEFNELDYDSALQVVSDVKKLRKYELRKSPTNCNVKYDNDPSFTLTTKKKARGLLKQIAFSHANPGPTILVSSIIYRFILFCLLCWFILDWKQKSASIWERSKICNRTELNLSFICTYRSPLSPVTVEVEQLLLTNLVWVYLGFLFVICLYNSLILIFVILKRCGYPVRWTVYWTTLMKFEASWLFTQRFGYVPITEVRQTNPPLPTDPPLPGGTEVEGRRRSLSV